MVPEVTRGKRVIVKCGQFQLPWEIFSAFLLRSHRSPNFQIPSRLINFVNAVTEMKSPDYTDPPRDWLDLALQFRQRVAGRPRDKLFALLGLLKSAPNQEILESYTSKYDREIFAAFARNYLVQTRDLSLLALAENREVLGCSWAVDWQKMTSAEWRDYDPFFSDDISPEYENMFWGEHFIVSPLVQGLNFKADGDQPAVCTAGPKGWNSLKVKGWKADEIARVAEAYDVESVKTDLTSDQEIISGWIKFAGGPWADPGYQNSIRFHRAIMAELGDTEFLDKLRADQTDVPHDVESQEPPLQDNLFEMKLLRLRQLKSLWAGHRFFLTSGGHFGLGPAKTKHGDHVCVLFGCRVPVVLHPWPVLSLKRREVDSYSFVGQAHVESLMYYEGDMEQNIKDKKIKVEEFVLQ